MVKSCGRKWPANGTKGWMYVDVPGEVVNEREPCVPGEECRKCGGIGVVDFRLSWMILCPECQIRLGLKW